MPNERDRSLAVRLFRRLLDRSARQLNARSSSYYTFHDRPKLGSDIGTWSDRGDGGKGIAVVMQGPIAEQDDFTLETLRLYRRFCPESHLVLSTWSDTAESLLAPIKAIGVDVVQVEKPEVAGHFNVNMQITSAAAGVRHACDEGAQWILKTRTDQRLYEPNALRSLVALAETFPVRTDCEQQHRIIGVGHGSLKFAPYHLTDQTVFGGASDMLLYWTPPLRGAEYPDHWPKDRGELYRGLSVGELCRGAAAESYLTSTYLERIGRKLDWTLADTWSAFHDHFCVADYNITDFYWVKSQTWSLHETVTAYDSISTRREMTFREWLLLYSGATQPADAARFEHVLETRFGDAISDPQG